MTQFRDDGSVYRNCAPKKHKLVSCAKLTGSTYCFCDSAECNTPEQTLAVPVVMSTPKTVSDFPDPFQDEDYADYYGSGDDEDDEDDEGDYDEDITESTPIVIENDSIDENNSIENESNFDLVFEEENVSSASSSIPSKILLLIAILYSFLP